MSRITEREKVEGVVTRIEEVDGQLRRVKIFDEGRSKKVEPIEPFSLNMRVKKTVEGGDSMKGTIVEQKMKTNKAGEEVFSGKIRIVWDGGGTTFEKVDDPSIKMIGIKRINTSEEE